MAVQRRDDSGLTLIEVVVALVVLGILAMATLGILMSSQKTSVDSRNRVAAANLAAREIDLVREKFLASDDGPMTVANEGVVVNGNPLSGGSAGQPLEVDGTPYTVRRSSSWNILGAGASACEGGSMVDHPALAVEVEVTWPGMGTTKPVRSSTILAPERGQGLPETTSFVAITIKDSKGQPHPGRTAVVFSPSESRSAVSDAAGCAVVAINPPPSGANYMARFPDGGYVDINGVTDSERSVGHMLPGEFSTSVQIALDRAAQITIVAVGDGLTDEDADGSTVSLFKSETSGNTSVTSHVLSGREVVIGGLWPTNYGAFFGTEIPPSIENMVTLGPGDAVTIPIDFSFATFTVDNAPTGGTMRAVPVGLDCTAASRRTVDPSAGRLPPGQWTFFYEHDDYGCAEGPAGEELFPGVNSPIAWADSSLRVTGAPSAGGSIWALSAGVSSSSCTSAGGKAIELGSSGGTVGPVTLPAGDWYVFAMEKSGNQPTGSDCIDAGLVAVPYGEDRVFAWPAHTASLRVTNVSSSSNTRIVASQNPSLTCTSRNVPSGAIGFSPENSSVQSGILPQGTWYIYRQNTSTSFFGGDRCSGRRGIDIGWAPSYTMNFNNGNVTTP